MLTIKQLEPTRLVIEGLNEADAIAFLRPIKEWRDSDSVKPFVISPPPGATIHLYDIDGTNYKMAIASTDILYHKPSGLMLSYIPKDVNRA